MKILMAWKKIMQIAHVYVRRNHLTSQKQIFKFYFLEKDNHCDSMFGSYNLIE